MKAVMDMLRGHLFDDIIDPLVEDGESDIVKKLLDHIDSIVKESIASWIVQCAHSEQCAQLTTLNAFYNKTYTTKSLDK